MSIDEESRGVCNLARKVVMPIDAVGSAEEEGRGLVEVRFEVDADGDIVQPGLEPLRYRVVEGNRDVQGQRLAISVGPLGG